MLRGEDGTQTSAHVCERLDPAVPASDVRETVTHGTAAWDRWARALCGTLEGGPGKADAKTPSIASHRPPELLSKAPTASQTWRAAAAAP
jgi:hypothetical protein